MRRSSASPMPAVLRRGSIAHSPAPLYASSPKAHGLPRVKRYLDEKKGNYLGDLWVDDGVAPLSANAVERLDYPTQKPEKLLERIILASSNPGDIVMDIFGGSGTTIAVAEKLGRRWITCDFGKHAIYTICEPIINFTIVPFSVYHVST